MFSRRNRRLQIDLSEKARVRLYRAADHLIQELRGDPPPVGTNRVLADFEEQMYGRRHGRPDNRDPFWGI